MATGILCSEWLGARLECKLIKKKKELFSLCAGTLSHPMRSLCPRRTQTASCTTTRLSKQNTSGPFIFYFSLVQSLSAPLRHCSSSPVCPAALGAWWCVGAAVHRPCAASTSQFRPPDISTGHNIANKYTSNSFPVVLLSANRIGVERRRTQ